MTSDRDARDEDVVSLDRYLDDHLVRAAPGPAAVPVDVPADIDPELARAARVVSMALARFHPSFRFEERLAARLRAEAGRTGATSPAEAHLGPAVVIPFAPPGRRPRSRSSSTRPPARPHPFATFLSSFAQ